MSTVLAPLFDIWDWVKGHNFLGSLIGVKKRRLSFITIHCTLKSWSKYNSGLPMLTFMLLDLYVIGLAILGSIVLYPGGNIAYIDALFLASGCATQSGLNT